MAILNEQRGGFAQIIQQMVADKQEIMKELAMVRRELRPEDGNSRDDEPARNAVNSLQQQFNHLPAELRAQLSELQGDLGRLAFVVGAYKASRAASSDAARHAIADSAKASDNHNAYLASLQDRDWPNALEPLLCAAELDAARYAPFPIEDLKPLSILGAGGFGVAFLCDHQLLGSRVVVKTLQPAQLGRDVKELFREANVLEHLNHPGIVRVRHAGFADAQRRRPYLVMDWFDGPSLDDYVHTHGPLPLDQALEMGRQLAEALAAAHQAGILHRDVKPRNVLVRITADRVQVKLIDFGLALQQSATRALAGGNTLLGSSQTGTLDYAAPEQLGKLPGVEAGRYSDVYSWAKTLCFARFGTPNPRPRQFQSLPEALQDLLDDSLADGRDELAKRPATMSALLSRLAACESSIAPTRTPAESALSNNRGLRLPPPVPLVSTAGSYRGADPQPNTSGTSEHRQGGRANENETRKRTETATLSDGRTIEYIPDVIGTGLMKQVYFTANKEAVACFYISQHDPHRLARLNAVVERYNPTLDPITGNYWKKRFCWPTAVIVKPRLGFLAPAYPRNYYFKSGNLTNKEKQGNWFSGTSAGGTPLRKLVHESERGTWINYFDICVNLVRAVRRLHAAALAHSDLSARNVLIDPTGGELCITDIDSLVVPRVFGPDIIGTRGYTAPEVVATQHLAMADPKRRYPDPAANRHAVAVLIYEYLLSRNPLKGPKAYPVSSGEEQDLMEWGPGALFIENPRDTSNRPRDLKVGCAALGPALQKLFEQAFVTGLHNPDHRPSVQQWERELVFARDLVTPCANPNCEQKHFILFDSNNPVCPFCKTRLKPPVLAIDLKYERAPGVWHTEWELVVSEVHDLMRWHVERGIFPDERADCTVQARLVWRDTKWLLVNEKLAFLMNAAGKQVLPGNTMELKPGMFFRLSSDPRARVAEVRQIL